MRMLVGATTFWLVFAAAWLNAQSDFFVIVKDGTPQSIQAAIDQGADVNAQQPGGLTPLMCAAATNKNAGAISALLKAGASLEARDVAGETALMSAAESNPNPTITITLLEAGADVNAQDAIGVSALGHASQQNNVEVVRALLKGGADFNAHGSSGLTPLIIAVENENLAVVTELLKAGADVNAKDNLGNTAFYYAQEKDKLRGTEAYSKLQVASQGVENAPPHSGVNGWLWKSATDPMTDVPYTVFFKLPSGPEVMYGVLMGVEYSKNTWFWGLNRSSGWKGDRNVTYRLGKRTAETAIFRSDGGMWLIHDGRLNIREFLTYPRVLARVENDDPPALTLGFDTSGLAETIKMAGLSIK